MSSANQQLRANLDQQYHLLTENVKDYAIFLLDTDGRIATWNSGAERVLGYQESEIVGKPFAILFTPPDILNLQPANELQMALDRGRSEDERWHVRKDGSQFWAMGVVTPLWDDGGELRGYAKIMRDITERMRAEMDLTESNRRKDEFLAMLAHELRNPLAPIINGLQLLLQHSTLGGQEKATIEMMDRQAKLIIRLVDDLLDVSRLTTGKVSLRRTRVQLKAIIDHAVETVQSLIVSRKHHLTVTLPDEAVWLDADPARLEQVMANLLTNAAKYTEPGGQIALSGKREGPDVIVRIVDSGIGILADMLPRIFLPFVQSDRSLDRAQGGLGIGLTLAKALVEMHGGKIEAHSAGIGHGSEFVVNLPVVTEVMPLRPEDVQSANQSSTAHALRLLVVDDNPDTVASLAMLLRIYGHDVVTANSGPTALEAALSDDRDVIVLDIGLPSVDGFEVARRIRAKTAKPVLIAMTGYGQPEDRKKSHDAGFDFHLTKPVEPTRLQELLTKIALGNPQG